jgi:replicative DNA helicase
MVDFVTLKEELIRIGDLDEVGGPAYVASLSDGVPRATNVKYYAGIVKEKAALRALIYAANKLLTDAYAAEDSAIDIVSRAETALLDVQNAHVSQRMGELRESTSALIADFDERVANRGMLTGVETGFTSINELTFGWQPGDLIVLAARPSIGKTTFVMNSALAAAKTGKRIAIFSMEMRRRQLEYRIVSSLSSVACTRLLSGFISSTEYPKISYAFELIHKLSVSIDDRARQTVHDIRSACRRMKAEGGLDMVVVDYVQLMPGSLDRKGSTRNEELTDISRRMKILADEIAAPIMMLSQLRRLDGRRRPQLEDLRESGALEQDSDIVAFLHRSDHRAGGMTEFILAKQRNGPTGTVKLSFERDTLTFTDAGQETEEDEKQAEEQAKPRRQRRMPYHTGPGQND